MITVGKKKLKEIEILSVFIEVMRERVEPRYDGGFFFDNAPDTWNKEDRNLFDVAAEIEHRLKEQITAILTSKRQPPSNG